MKKKIQDEKSFYWTKGPWDTWAVINVTTSALVTCICLVFSKNVDLVVSCHRGAHLTIVRPNLYLQCIFIPEHLLQIHKSVISNSASEARVVQWQRVNRSKSCSRGSRDIDINKNFSLLFFHSVINVKIPLKFWGSSILALTLRHGK